MHVHWQTFEQDGQTVEAQVFHPDTPSQKLILFCPGFPGLGATIFEQRHAAELAEQGYDVVVIKHAGTRLDSGFGPMALNNAARLAQGRRDGEVHLGGGPSSVAAWLREPAIALQNLHVNYADITVIGNSFGAVAALWSLLVGGAPAQAIHRLILMAGAQGVDSGAEGIMRIWNPVFLANSVIAQSISVDSPDSIVATMESAYADINHRAADLPAHIALTYLVVSNDELLSLKDTEAFKNDVMKGRGDIVIDDMETAYPIIGLTAHYMPNYPTNKLLELL